LTPIRQGGTGTQSDSAEQPATLPDRYESGNHNVPGILGLGAGVAYLQQRGLADIRRHDQELAGRLIARFLQIGGVTVHGPSELPRRVGVVSISVAGYDPQELAVMLDSACGIQVRAGLHCAALMHRSLGTADRGGTVRFSLGPFTTAEDIDAAAEAIEQAGGG
jgi:selenocysteine lyase/cysteine desulfurase